MITRQAIFRSWPFTNNNSNRRRNNVYEIIDVCILCMIWQILRNICWEMIFCTSHHPCIVILFCVIWVVSWAGGEQVELVLPSVACPWLTHCLVRSRYPSISLFIHRFRSFSTTYDQKKHNEIEGETHVTLEQLNINIKWQRSKTENDTETENKLIAMSYHQSHLRDRHETEQNNDQK